MKDFYTKHYYRKPRKIQIKTKLRKPRCFPSRKDYIQWLYIALQHKPQSSGYCYDCTPEFKKEMTRQGRCQNPNVYFVLTRCEGVQGRKCLTTILELKNSTYYRDPIKDYVRLYNLLNSKGELTDRTYKALLGSIQYLKKNPVFLNS